MTLAVLPSMAHSKVVSGPMWSCFLTSDGTETWPRFVTFVRIGESYMILTDHTSHRRFAACTGRKVRAIAE